MAKKDACYSRIKRRYAVWPSARASQALAKCRKASGNVSKTKAGASLKRWGAEKWVNTKTGRPCGNKEDKTEYCRPTKKVSKKTPALRGNAKQSINQKRKSSGLRATPVHTKR